MKPASPIGDPTAGLIARARTGDPVAYDQLFARAAQRLQLYLRARMGPGVREKEETLDLLQETYLAALCAFPGFADRGDGAFVRWLCRIAENCIRGRVDYHQAEKRAPAAEIERLSQIRERIAAGTLGPATRVERRDQRRVLREAMEALPQDEREALLMRHFQDLNIETIADRLGISPTSARRLLGRATLHLGVDLNRRQERGE